MVLYVFHYNSSMDDLKKHITIDAKKIICPVLGSFNSSEHRKKLRNTTNMKTRLKCWSGHHPSPYSSGPGSTHPSISIPYRARFGCVSAAFRLYTEAPGWCARSHRNANSAPAPPWMESGHRSRWRWAPGDDGFLRIFGGLMAGWWLGRYHW